MFFCIYTRNAGDAKCPGSMRVFLRLAFCVAAVCGAAASDSCTDLAADSQVTIDFGSGRACDAEEWDAVSRVVIENKEGGGSFFECRDGKREFVWARRPRHAPWDEWMRNRLVFSGGLELLPRAVCVPDAPGGVFCGDDGYYREVCNRAGGYVVGGVLSASVFILVVVFAIRWRAATQSRSAATSAARPAACAPASASTRAWRA